MFFVLDILPQSSPDRKLIWYVWYGYEALTYPLNAMGNQATILLYTLIFYLHFPPKDHENSSETYIKPGSIKSFTIFNK